MTGERQIDYETLGQTALHAAMRSMVRDILVGVAKSGLPGEHHFYIAFNTTARGVTLSKRLQERYPAEMTIILQHRFWDLAVDEDSFEVKLTFDGIPERVVVPFAALKVFFDPSVPYGLQFEDGEARTARDLREAGTVSIGDAATALVGAASERAEKKPRAPRKPKTDKAADAPAPAKPARPQLVASRPEGHEAAANDAKVVHIDKFRKR
jgi:hypothetical protein